MPGLVTDAGDLRLVLGIAEDKTVAPAVFLQPLPCLRGILFVFHNDIQRQAQLMLAGAGLRHDLQRPLLRLLRAQAFGLIGGDIIVQDLLLTLGGAIGLIDQRINALSAGVVEHLLQLRVDPLIDPLIVAQLLERHRIVLRHGMLGVDQDQLPVVSRIRLRGVFFGSRFRLLCGRLRIFFRFGGLFLRRRGRLLRGLLGRLRVLHQLRVRALVLQLSAAAQQQDCHDHHADHDKKPVRVLQTYLRIFHQVAFLLSMQMRRSRAAFAA